MGARFLLPLLSLGLLFGIVSAASAQDEEEGLEASEARLGLLSRDERALLDGHLDRGPVALVEFNGEAELPAIIFATKVRAPAARIARVIADPRGYPRYMPALDSLEVRSRRGRTLAYDWAWRTAIFTLEGSTVMTVYPGPGTRRDRPWRIGTRNTGGDLGTGRQVWRVYPSGENESLLVLSSRLDVRDANWVTRQIGGQRSINRTINMSLAFVMVTGVRDEAERLVGAPPRSEDGAAPALGRPDVDFRAFARLLDRGDLVFMDMRGNQLDRVTVAGRLGQGLDRVREVITDPREFGPALVPGSYANITAENDGRVDFDWGIDIPLIGAEGAMVLRDTGSTVEVDATSGALNGGRWRFDTFVYPWGEAAVLGWARFDPADASFLIRAITDQNPRFSPGIAAGSQVMVLRAIRSRVWRRHEQRAAAEAAAEAAHGGG